jgi:hypothetical protein
MARSLLLPWFDHLVMKITIFKSVRSLLSFLVVVALAAGCSDAAEQEGAVAVGRMEDGVIKVDASTKIGEEADTSDRPRKIPETRTPPAEKARAAGTGGTSSGAPNKAAAGKKDPADELFRERRSTMNELAQLRKELDQELVKVKERLEDRKAADRKADKARASELNKALRILGRLEKNVTKASDEKWPEVHKKFRKEVDDLRAMLAGKS